MILDPALLHNCGLSCWLLYIGKSMIQYGTKDVAIVEESNNE